MRINNEHDAFDAMLCELHRARHLYPNWPTDLVHAAAIVSEECGEVLQAANNLAMHGRGSAHHVRIEAIQAGAMVLRLLCDTAILRDIDNPKG